MQGLANSMNGELGLAENKHGVVARISHLDNDALERRAKCIKKFP